MVFASLRCSLLRAIFWTVLLASLLGLLLPFAAAQESILVTATDGSLSVYDLATYALQKNFPSVYFNNAITVGVNPRLAFLLGDTGFMTVVDPTIGKEIKRIYNVGGTGIPVVTPDGRNLLVWDDFNATLDIIDIVSLSVTKRIDLSLPIGIENVESGGTIVLAGNQAFLIPFYTAFVTQPKAGVVDLSTFKVTAIPYKKYEFSGWTANAALTPDGKYVAVAGDVTEQSGVYAELLLLNTSTYAITSQMLSIDPNGFVVTPNRNDISKFFGYVTFDDLYSFAPSVAAVDFRPGSPTYAQVLFGTEVQMPNFSRTEIYGSGLAISSDGGKLAIGGDNTEPPYYNLIAVDTGLMFSDPMHAVVASLFVANGAATEGVNISKVDLVPPDSAPTVTGEQGAIVNDKPTDITISGANFLSGALVRIGKTPPLNSTFINGNTLQVTVPANVPSDPAADLVVTNPESNHALDQQYQSGALATGLTVALNPSFQPQEQFAVLSSDNVGSVGLFNLQQRSTATLTASPNPDLWGIAFSADGAEIFGAGYTTVTAWDASTGQMHGNQLDLGTRELSVRKPIFSSTSPLTGKPVIYAAAGIYTRPYDIALLTIDADRGSPTFNTVIGTLAAGLQFQGPRRPLSQVATPDGKYVYVPYLYNDNNLLIFDVVNGTATVFSLAKYQIQSATQQQPIISADGKYLVLRGIRLSYPFVTQLDVFDIFSDRKKPRLVGAITVPRAWQHPGPFPSPDMFSCQILGNHIFVVSHFAGSVMTFNFKPANNDFRPVSLYQLPGDTNYIAGRIALSPEGSYLYVPGNAGNMTIVLDPNKLVHNQDALITTIASTDATREIVVSPVPPPPRVNATTRQSRKGSARH